MPFIKVLQKFQFVAQSSLSVFSDESLTDDEQQKLMQKYAIEILKYTMLLALLFTVFFGIIALIWFALNWEQFGDWKIFDQLTSINGIAISTIVAIVFFIIQKKYNIV